MELLLISGFVVLCWLTLRLLRWILHPLWPHSDSNVRTQFFVTDALVLALQFGASMVYASRLDTGDGERLGLMLFFWFVQSVVWILCCRALTQARVLAPLPRSIGLLALPAGIAACCALSASTTLMLLQVRWISPEYILGWSLSVLAVVSIFPPLSHWIANHGEMQRVR